MSGFAPPGAPPPGPPPAGYYAGPPMNYGSPPPPMHHGGPPAPTPAPPGGGFTVQDTIGTFEGANYRIDHRDSNSILHLTLQQGYEVKGKPGAMVTMQATVQIKGNFKFSLKKMVTGGEMAESTYTGPGEVVLAPDVWGDIVPVRVSLALVSYTSELSSYCHLPDLRLIPVCRGVWARTPTSRVPEV